MPSVDRLARGRLARPDRDHVSWVLLREQADVRRAGELETYGFLSVVAEAIAHAGREALVGDADVLADPEARNAGERTRRRLENEAHCARLALRRELVVVRVKHDWLRLPGPEAVLEERAARDVVLEQLRETTLACAHRLVNGLRLLFGGLAHEDLSQFFGATQGFVLGLGPARECVDQVGRRGVDVPLDDGAALHVYEHGAGVSAEDVLVVAVDVVVALLARRRAALRENSLSFQQRRVRVRPKVRKIDAPKHAVPVHIVSLSAPEILLGLTYLSRRVKNAATRELLAHDEHPLLQPVGLRVFREEVPPERRGHQC